jgi:hypothetical protein
MKTNLEPVGSKLPKKLLKQLVVLIELQKINTDLGSEIKSGADIVICGGGCTTDNVAVLVKELPFASVHLTVTDISPTVCELRALEPDVPLIDKGPAVSVQFENPFELHLKVDD